MYSGGEQFKLHMELADRLLQEKRTPEEALQALIRAGIMDEDGNYTEPYKIFEQYSASK